MTIHKVIDQIFYSQEIINDSIKKKIPLIIQMQ